jgi:hypothetical protein
MAEGKAYHVGYGLYDRKLAGLRVSDDHFGAFVPEGARIVAFYPSVETAEGGVAEYLPEFTRRVDVAELPGWTVYMRTGPTQGAGAALR